MNTRTRLLGAATVLSFTMAMGAGATATASPTGSGASTAVAPMQVQAGNVPVTGEAADGTAFTGSLTDLSARTVDGVVQLTGTITGTLGDQTISDTFTAGPASAAMDRATSWPDTTASPSTQRVQAPQLEVSQPQWVPRRPASSRSCAPGAST